MQRDSVGEERWEWPQARRYVGDAGGHPPSYFAKVLAETIPIERGKTRLLDIGSGSGIIGIFCIIEKGAAFATFNDIQPEMMAAARVNVEWHMRSGEIAASQVAFLQASFREIAPDVIAGHDLLAFNPPQLPQSLASQDYLAEISRHNSEMLLRLGEARSNPDGLAVVREFLAWYAKLKGAKPKAIITLSSFLGKSRIAQAIQASNLRSEIVARTRVPLRPALTAAATRIAANEAQRMDRSLEPSPDGNWTKEILTICVFG